MTLHRSALPALTLALMMVAPAARTQTPAATPAAPAALPSPPAAAPAAAPAAFPSPPAGYTPPPAGYTPPPAGYAPPPGYSYPPAYFPQVWVPQGPSTLPYKDGYLIPAGYYPEKRMRMGLVAAGAATFGAMYVLSAGVAASADDKSLFVPIAGPFIQIANLDFGSGHLFSGPAAVLLVIDGLAQTAGAAMLLVGLTARTEVLARDKPAGVTVRVTPLTMANGGMGIGLVGTM